jgi:hypothetical protein
VVAAKLSLTILASEIVIMGSSNTTIIVGAAGDGPIVTCCSDGTRMEVGDIICRKIQNGMRVPPKHHAVYIGNSQVVELLEDGRIHVSRLGLGSWANEITLIRRGSQGCADRALHYYATKKDTWGYHLLNNNCQQFCAKCFGE